jgi:leucyl-tRNA synthetase
MTDAERDLNRTAHQTIKQVTDALTTSFGFNTAISDLIKLTNAISASDVAATSPIYQNAVRSLVTMMAPMAPCMAEESWEALSPSPQTGVFQQAWPLWEEDALVKDTVDCVIQVNGKTRLTVPIPASLVANADQVEQLTRATPQGQKWLGNHSVRKAIVAKNGALVNFIV